MSLQVRQYIKNCQLCRETKPHNQNTRPTIGQEVRTERPFQKIYVDFLGKYPRSKHGNAYIFIVLDHFTKFVFLKAMKEATSKNVVEFLVREVFQKFGVPETLHSDNGQQFLAANFKEMISTYGIDHIKTAFYSPQSNAAERVNQTVLAAIRTYLNNDHRDWDLYLPEIEHAIRTSVHAATGFTPFFALFGYHIYSHGTDYKLARKLQSMTEHEIININRNDKLNLIREKIRENLSEAYEKSAKRYNERACTVKFTPGQEVYRRNFVQSDFKRNINAKFCRKYIKCRIVKPIGGNMYELESLQGKPIGIFHSKDLKV